MVRKTSCFMLCNGGNGRQDGPCYFQTAYKSLARDGYFKPTQILSLSCGRKELSCGSCIQKRHSHTPNTHIAPLGINFCPGPAGCSESRNFGTRCKSYSHVEEIDAKPEEHVEPNPRQVLGGPNAGTDNSAC